MDKIPTKNVSASHNFRMETASLAYESCQAMLVQTQLDLFPRAKPWGYPYASPCPLASECINNPTGCTGESGSCGKAIIFATGEDPYRELRSDYEKKYIDSLMARHNRRTAWQHGTR